MGSIMSAKAKETASNTMEAIRKKMISLKTAKENSADKEKDLQNTVVELNNLLKEKDNDILQLGKKIMKVENGLDDATEALAASTLAIEEAEKQQLVNEEEVSALQRRCSLLDTDLVTTENRLTVESKSFINDEKIDNLDERIITAQGIALISTRN